MSHCVWGHGHSAAEGPGLRALLFWLPCGEKSGGEEGGFLKGLPVSFGTFMPGQVGATKGRLLCWASSQSDRPVPGPPAWPWAAAVRALLMRSQASPPEPARFLPFL